MSPTLKPPTSAECLSITTWPGLRGGCPPVSSRNGLSAVTSVHPKPSVGAPLPTVPIGLPFLPTIRA